MNGSAHLSSTQTVQRRGLLQRVIPVLLLLAFVAFRELNPQCVDLIDDGPHTSVSRKHEMITQHPGCSNFRTSSMEDLWRGIQGSIFNSTYLPDNNDRVEKNATQQDDDEIIRSKMIQWTQHLMDFHTTERLRRALGNRPSSSTILRVLSIISDYPKTKVPLKILITGGSVTAGHWCIDNPVGWNGGKGGAPFKECAWPSRLERHLRQLFFNDPNIPGVVVYNMAVGATTVDVATMILQYGLLPEELLQPDVVLLAHSPNDANALNLEQLFYTHLNNAVHAAKRLQACDEHLPLVGIIDDNVGMNNISQAMETTARYYATSSWYHLLYINYGNAVRHTLLQRYNENRTEPLLGGKFQVHGGMGFHISMAWTVVFNLMSVMMDSCHDFLESEEEPYITSELWEKEADLESLQNVSWAPASSKWIADLQRTSDPSSVNRQWREALKANEVYCQSFESKEIQPVCTHAWMINKLAGIMRPRDINRAMKPVMKSSFGWEASGNFYSYPRLGYYASEEKANFYLEIPVTALTIYFTILSTVSYGPNFIDTNLRIEVKVGRKNEPEVFNVSGYHAMQTSPLVPHKFRLPQMAYRGDVIYFNATLTSGSYFKIAGLAFCKQ